MHGWMEQGSTCEDGEVGWRLAELHEHAQQGGHAGLVQEGAALQRELVQRLHQAAHRLHRIRRHGVRRQRHHLRSIML